MHRFTAVMISLTIGVSSALAGAIQIGGTTGLTGSYIASGCSANIAGQSCVTGTTGGFVESGYSNMLFSNASLAPSPGTNYSPTSAGVSSITGGAAFSMIDDGCGGTSGGACTGGAVSNNFWGAGTGPTAGGGNGGNSNAIVVPIGIYDVTDVWTMLNDVWGGAGVQDTVLAFNFSSTAANGPITTTITLNLVNASNTAGNSGQIGTSVDCTTTNTKCSYYAVDSLQTNGTLTSTGPGAQVVTVNTNSAIFGSSYTSATGKFINSQGNVTLDDQQFIFSGIAGLSTDYLVSIGVSDLNGAIPGSTAGSGSETALSAITVDSPVPEPSTVVLLLAGLGTIGASRFRRFKRS